MQSPLHILHLEDDAKDAELLLAMLEAAGIVSQVTLVDSQADFLASLEQGGCDLILADYSLPSFDGLSALKIALAKCPDVPFIFVSGTLGEEVAVEALKIGAADYILKERLSRLVPSVQRALREAQARAGRKRAEGALRESEERFRALVTASSDALYRMSADWSEMINLRGMDFISDTLQPNRNWLAEYIPQDEQPRVTAAIKEAIRAKGVFELEHRVFLADGTIGWTSSRAVPMLDDVGEITEWFGAADDITERRRAEEALRESERRYRYIFQAAGVSIWEEDFSQIKAAIDELKAQGVRDFRQYLAEHPEFIWRVIPMVKVIDVNEVTVKLFRARSKEELLVSLDKVLGLIPVPEAEKVFAGQLIAIAEGQTSFVFENSAQTLDGDKLTVLFTITFPSQPSRFDNVLVSIMDITERKRAEEALRESEQRYRTLFEKANDAIFLENEHDEIIEVNERACALLGYSREELLKMKVSDLQAPELGGQVGSVVRDEIEKHGGATFESMDLHRSGRRIAVEVTNTPIYDRGQKLVLSIVRDITERKRQEGELRQAQATQFEIRLETRVMERTRIARELHDTLLQSFQGLLLRFQSVLKMLPDRPLEARQRLESTLDQAAEAITDARVAIQGLRSLAAETSDLARVITAVGAELTAHRTDFNPPAIHVEVEGAPRNLKPVVRDEAYRIACEALRNAFRHAQARRITVEIRYDKRHFQLTVRDDGKGFDEATMQHQPSGHFGLPGMRERAEIVGGHLEVCSKLNSGTQVELSIPGSIAYDGAFHQSVTSA